MLFSYSSFTSSSDHGVNADKQSQNYVLDGLKCSLLSSRLVSKLQDLQSYVQILENFGP